MIEQLEWKQSKKKKPAKTEVKDSYLKRNMPIQRLPQYCIPERSAVHVIQMYHRSDNAYAQTDFTWGRVNKVKFWTRVTNGITLAIRQLDRVMEAWIQESVPNHPLAIYAQSIKEVLEDDDLWIYPLNMTGYYGMSSYNKRAISVSINIRTEESMAKTLIHEGFHIIGGCWEITPDGKHEPRKDETSDTATRIDHLYDKMAGKDITDINADTFAQYAMLF